MELALSGPILVVIDGLDQCNDAQKRRKLLRILSDTGHQLPQNFRIILGSGSEKQELELLAHRFGADQLMVHATNLDDISAYVQATLTDQEEQPLDGVDAAACRVIANISATGGTFESAISTCQYIKGPGFGTPGIMKRLQEIIQPSLPAAVHDDDVLYYSLLSYSFPAQDTVLRQQFNSVMAEILIARASLSKNAVRQLRKYRDFHEPQPHMGPEAVDAVLQSDWNAEITWKNHLPWLDITQHFLLALPLHPSLASFLLDRCRSRELFVDKTGAERAMAMSCLRTLNSELKFDICQFPSSHLRNGDVEDLGSRISQFISPQLAYACRFFVEHIRCVAFEVALSVELDTLLRKKFLLWMEVASLLQLIDQMVTMLTVLEDWIKPGGNKNLKALIAKAHQFVIAFGGMASESTPHIYISALAMAPPGSFILSQPHPKYSWLSHVVRHTVWDVPPSAIYNESGRLIASFCEDAKAPHSGWFLGPDKELLLYIPVSPCIAANLADILETALDPHLGSGPAWKNFQPRYTAIQQQMPVQLRLGETDIREVSLCLVRILEGHVTLVSKILDLAEYWLVTSMKKTRSIHAVADGFDMYCDPFMTVNIQGAKHVAPVRRFEFDLLFAGNELLAGNVERGSDWVNFQAKKALLHQRTYASKIPIVDFFRRGLDRRTVVWEQAMGPQFQSACELIKSFKKGDVLGIFASTPDNAEGYHVVTATVVAYTILF